MGISIGMVGVGAFAQCFIPLFKAHPLVGRMALCDVSADKLAENSRKHGIGETYCSLDAACDSDLDALVIITQNWMHAPQATQALQAGKHVYSAVPMGITVEEIAELVRNVERTGLIYMMGETSYYNPATVYCRQRFRAGQFGRIVYAEAEYYHDFDHGLYDVLKWRGGSNWKRYAGCPPMLYPTHSTGGILAVTDTYLTHVSCQGFVDQHEDGLFRKEVNQWGNEFSNETALFRAADGSSIRINEFRRCGHPGVERIAAIVGTEASFEFNRAGSVWLTRDKKRVDHLDELLACQRLAPQQVEGGMEKLKDDAAHFGVAPVHDLARLPRQFRGLPNGHGGSHQFLVDDFVQAVVKRQQPPVHAWRSARYTIPGLVAHESARRGGVLLEVPDLGPGPGEAAKGAAPSAT